MSGDVSGAGTPADDGQQPWSVRPGGPGTPGYQPDPYAPHHAPHTGSHDNPHDPFPAHAQTPQPQRPFEQQHSQQTPFGDRDEPDWSRLAASRDASARRRRMMFIAGATVLAVGAVGAVVLATTTMSGDDQEAAANTTGPSVSATPFAPAQPSFRPAPTVPAPLSAQAVLADAELDKAPFTVASLFPKKKFSVNGRQYTIVASQARNTCSDGADAKLGPVLRSRQCTQIIRLAVTAPGGIVSTAAVASFPDAAKATAVKAGKEGGVAAPLAGAGVKALDPKKQKYGSQRNSLGRYAMFTLDWYADGKDPVGQDKAMFQVEDDLNKFLWNSLLARGEETSRTIDAENRRKALEQVQG